MTLIRFTAVLTIILAVLGGCRPAMVTQENAQGFDYSIVEAGRYYRLTMADYYNKLIISPLFPKGGIVQPSAYAYVLDSIVCDSLVGHEADSLRLEDYYESYRLYRMRYYDALIDAYFDETVYGKVEKDSLKIVEFYNNRPDLFSVEEHQFIYDILISPKGLKYGPDSLKYEDYTDEQMAQEAEKAVQDIHSQISSLNSFQRLAQMYSHDTLSGREGGLIGWSKRGVYLDPFDSVAFALKPGQWSEPYLGRFGWHILFCAEHMPEGIPPLTAQMWEGAVYNYSVAQSNRMGLTLLDSLFRHIDIEYNEELLDTNLFLVDVQQWVAVVNGQDTLDCNDALNSELKVRKEQGVPNTTPDMKKEMLIEPARRLVLVQAARSISIDTLPRVVAEERSLRHKYCKMIAVKERSDPSWQPSDSMLAQYYEEHQDDFEVEKPLTVQHIIFEDSLFADFVRGQAMSGYEFLELAEEYYPGEPEVRRELADLGPISAEDVSPEFWKAAQRTPLGEVSPPVKTEYGYHIIKILERREAMGLSQARPQLVQLLKERHKNELFEKFRDRLYKKYRVKFTGKLAPAHLEPVTMRD